MARKPLTLNEIKRGERLAEKIQKQREQRGLTQKVLAKVSGVGIDTLRAIEGRRVPQPGVFTLSDLAQALGVTVDELIPKRSTKGSK